MTNTKRFAIIVAVVFLAVLLSVVVGVAWMVLFPPSSMGLAAVSVGISEVIVEAFVIVLVVFLSWRVWILARRYWRRTDGSR